MYLRDSTSEHMAPGPSFYIVYNLVYLLLIIITPQMGRASCMERVYVLV